MASRGTTQTQIAANAHGVLQGSPPTGEPAGSQADQPIEGHLTHIHTSVPGTLHVQRVRDVCQDQTAPQMVQHERIVERPQGEFDLPSLRGEATHVRMRHHARVTHSGQGARMSAMEPAWDHAHRSAGPGVHRKLVTGNAERAPITEHQGSCVHVFHMLRAGIESVCPELDALIWPASTCVSPAASARTQSTKHDIRSRVLASATETAVAHGARRRSSHAARRSPAHKAMAAAFPLAPCGCPSHDHARSPGHSGPGVPSHSAAIPPPARSIRAQSRS
jgi:hypothetical protein